MNKAQIKNRNEYWKDEITHLYNEVEKDIANINFLSKHKHQVEFSMKSLQRLNFLQQLIKL